jgi:glycosyltransferase involved in cell wall biosynthesis
LTVVIASCNRRDLLRRCLTALDRQTQDPASFEIVVALDGATDGTAEMVEGLALQPRLRLLRLERKGKSTALNAAIDAAEGDVCLMLDDDIVASPDLVAEHLAAHRAGPRSICIGALSQQPPHAHDWYARAFATAWNEHYEELERRSARWTDCYGGNLSAPRSALVEVGGLATDLAATADIDLAFRLCAAGCTPRFLPRARAVHDDQKRGKRMIADRQRYGAAYVYLAARHSIPIVDVLGSFRQAGDRWVPLRRSLIAMRVPARWLAPLGGLLPGAGRRMTWFHFVSKLALWRGIRASMTRSQWLRAQLAAGGRDLPQEGLAIVQSRQ